MRLQSCHPLWYILLVQHPEILPNYIKQLVQMLMQASCITHLDYLTSSDQSTFNCHQNFEVSQRFNLSLFIPLPPSAPVNFESG